VRRNVAFLVGLGAGLAALGLLRRRRAVTAASGGGTVGEGEGATGLRRRLAESRAGAGETSAAESAGPTPEEPDAELDRARAAVHRDAHATLDEMRRAGL
jgi:hypothetical protein